MIPTFLGITIISFIIINLAPGSPVQQLISDMRFAGGGGGGGASGSVTGGESGVNEEIIAELNRQYGFDKPLLVRYGMWLKNIFTLDFGESFAYRAPVLDVIISKIPVSAQFGIISFFLTYLICIPLGVMKAVRNGTRFDRMTSSILFVAYSIPPLMLGILMIVFLAGRLDLFPIQGFVSDDYDYLSVWGKIVDRAHHFVLPGICYMINSFTTLTILMKNSMLDVVSQDYIRTARAKGLSENVVNFKHALRNALIPIATGLSGFLGVFFAGSIIIESIFGLDGIGKLQIESIYSRDYNVIMALIFISSVVLLVGRLVSDLLYVFIDPRIDFE